MSQRAPHIATLHEFWAIPEAERFHELIAGEVTEKAHPSGEHGSAQAGIVGAVLPSFHRPTRGGGPGGWWIATEVEVLLETGEVVRPDILGWRRERGLERPVGTPVRVRPDWICEIVSSNNASNDTVKKLRLYHRVGIPHYWLADTRDATLAVLRWSEVGYVTVLTAERGEYVRAEPFDAIELAVGALFGDDPPEA
jgi:Uma2 family endonuclease